MDIFLMDEYWERRSMTSHSRARPNLVLLALLALLDVAGSASASNASNLSS